MKKGQILNKERNLSTPRSAAIAGIVFAILLTVSYVLIRISIPTNPYDGGEWLTDSTEKVAFALVLIPFSGMAFLWFIGVLRDHMRRIEDKFFSTVFMGSGLLYLAMIFISAAIAGTILTLYTVESGKFIDSGIYTFGRILMHRITNIYSIRMAGMFMISIGNIWVRTLIMPRWLAVITFASSITLLVSIGLNLWVTLIFPGWVFLVSIYILSGNFPTNLDGKKDSG